jgi:elongation factor P
MAVVATKLSKGQAISYKGETGMVLHLEHRTPGKGNALIMATIRSFKTGKTKDIRFASGDKVDIIQVDRQKLEFSYSDPSGYYFMDPQTFEQVELSSDLLADAKNYLVENMSCDVIFVDGEASSVELPPSVELTVKESSEGIKGDTANNPRKPATLETGLEVQVPLFVKTGDVLKIDTRSGEYLGRGDN